MTEDEKLLINLKRKKRGTLEKVIDIYTPYVSVIVYNIIGNVMTKEDAEEVVADVFVSLWRSADTLDCSKGNLRAYLGAVARNCSKKKLRDCHIHSELDENIAADIKGLDETAAEAEEKQMLLTLIKELGEPDCEIFLRHYWYGEKLSKISAATGVCKSTVTTKLQRGRKKLKEIIMQREVRQ